MIALIPARAGSKRVPGKNTRLLAGHPLIAYTIAAAQDCALFSDVFVAADDEWTLTLADEMGAVAVRRALVSDGQCDVEWVREIVDIESYADSFAILRPTSPFRTAETITRAFREFMDHEGQYRSIRAVERAKQTPFKMWELNTNGTMQAIVARSHANGVPFHSSPTQSLPQAYVQNSSLEMSMTRNVTELGTIHGRTVYPFFTHGYEGLSIDTEADWNKAVEASLAIAGCLPKVPARV